MKRYLFVRGTEITKFPDTVFEMDTDSGEMTVYSSSPDVLQTYSRLVNSGRYRSLELLQSRLSYVDSEIFEERTKQVDRVISSSKQT